jgi:hypothetical protein
MRQMVLVVPFVLVSMVVIGLVVSGVALIDGTLGLITVAARRPGRRCAVRIPTR